VQVDEPGAVEGRVVAKGHLAGGDACRLLHEVPLVKVVDPHAQQAGLAEQKQAEDDEAGMAGEPRADYWSGRRVGEGGTPSTSVRTTTSTSREPK
jgi:hypothetical protein